MDRSPPARLPAHAHDYIQDVRTPDLPADCHINLLPSTIVYLALDGHPCIPLHVLTTTSLQRRIIYRMSGIFVLPFAL